MSQNTWLDQFNQLSKEQAEAELFRCCGSRHFARQVAGHRPFANGEDLLQAADRVWISLSPSDWREAFSHHPKIGARIGARSGDLTGDLTKDLTKDLKDPKERFSATAHWAKEEQKGVEGSSEALLQSLAAENENYEKRFGHIFLVCATGKNAQEMLALLQERIHNDPEVELRIAAQEQGKITRIRLEKLLK